MPTYEYSCPDCGHRFDIWQPVGSQAPACEKCGHSTKKIFHPSRVIFKGPGFYVTDLASEKSAASKTKDSSDSSKSDSKEAAPAESKAESKSESKTEVKESAPASTSSTSSSESSGGDKK